MYQYLKYEWNTADDEKAKRKAYNMLTSYVKTGLDRVDRSFIRPDTRDDRKLRCKYKLKQGTWLYRLNKERKTDNPAGNTIEFFREAKELDEKWYKPWHKWAMMNLDAAQPEKLKELKSDCKKVDDRIRFSIIIIR